MDRNKLEKLISENLSTHGIAKRMNQSQTNVRYWLKKHGLNTNYVANCNSVCSTCGAALKGKQTKFCSKQCKDDTYTSNPNNYLAQQARAKSRKLQLINYKGGECEVCGYKKNYSALTFHHKDPTNKTFTVDSRRCSNTNWESLVKEADKCSLLCHNCHAELHHPTLIVEYVPFCPNMQRLKMSR